MLLTSDSNEAVTEYQAAKEELERVARADGHESDRYLDANQRVIDAENKVSVFRR